MSLYAMAKELGLRELYKYAPEYLSEIVRHWFDGFDSAYGTDTNAAVQVDSLQGVGTNQASAELYWPVRKRPFKRMMAALDVDLRNFSFIDLGCGKGRALLLALDHPFGEIIGVDFSPKLCSVARRNIGVFDKLGRLNGRSVRIECIDAGDFRFPLSPLVVFLFDPFGPDVLRRVISNLQSTLAAQSRPCYVLYHLPMHGYCFLEAGFSVITQQRRGLHVSYPWVLLRN